MWEKYDGARQITDNKIRRMRVGFVQIRPHVHTHAREEHAILIAFALQQWLHECASILRHTYIACLFSSVIIHLVDITDN
jgi:hypothetical protein